MLSDSKTKECFEIVQKLRADLGFIYNPDSFLRKQVEKLHGILSLEIAEGGPMFREPPGDMEGGQELKNE